MSTVKRLSPSASRATHQVLCCSIGSAIRNLHGFPPGSGDSSAGQGIGRRPAKSGSYGGLHDLLWLGDVGLSVKSLELAISGGALQSILAAHDL